MNKYAHLLGGHVFLATKRIFIALFCDIHDLRRNFYENIIACNRNNTNLCITMEVHQVSTLDFILQ